MGFKSNQKKKYVGLCRCNFITTAHEAAQFLLKIVCKSTSYTKANMSMEVSADWSQIVQVYYMLEFN